MILGIDLGTTNSVAAYMSADGPKLIPNALGEVLTPSVVGIDHSGELLVGRAARQLQVVAPERCAATFKRKMGTDWSTTLAGQVFTPERLSSLVLRSLKQDAEVLFGQPITQAVITVPAYFNEPQRRATIEAGQIAGLEVLRILNEPTAAAIAYGLHESRDEKTVLVVDLGGGTFDVSVVEMFEGVVEVRASSGDSFLGGEDFSVTLAARLLETQGLQFEYAEMSHPLLVSRLNSLCETAKCRLSSEPQTTVRIPANDGTLPDSQPIVEVTREQFDRWTEPILRRIDLPIQRALADGKVAPETLTEVLLVGGATRMPAVVARLTQRFGRPPQCRLNPDEVVALGAAVQAGLIGRNEALEDLVVTDVAPFTLGVAISKRFGGEHRDGYMLPVIHRNTTIPVSRSQRVQTVHPNQTEITVKVYQGENRMVEQNLLLGEFAVKGIPRGPAGQELDIRFTYDLNGVLEVEATIVASGRKVAHVITRHTHGLSAAEVARAVADMQKLKTPPREEAANRALMKQAARLYEELPLAAQQQLGMLLDGFEEAMELGDRKVIAEHAAALQAFLDEFDNSWGGSEA